MKNILLNFETFSLKVYFFCPRSYLVKCGSLRITVLVSQLLLVLHRALDEILIHYPNQSVVVVEP